MALIATPPPPSIAIYSVFEDGTKRSEEKIVDISRYLQTQLLNGKSPIRKNNLQKKLDFFLTDTFKDLVDKFARDIAFLYQQKKINNEKLTLLIKAFVNSILHTNILDLNHKKIGVEANAKSVYLFIKNDLHNIHYEVFYDHSLPQENFEVVLNIFKNRERLLSKSIGLTKVSDILSKYENAN